MIALSFALDFPIEFLRADAHFLARKTLVFRHVLRSETMSLVTYPNSATAKVSGAAPGKSAMPTKCHSPTIADRLRAFFRATGRWITIAFDAVLEARAQRAMIEAQLYLNRCKHTSKNDDDLPVLR
jgi:hypothetical protein